MSGRRVGVSWHSIILRFPTLIINVECHSGHVDHYIWVTYVNRWNKIILVFSERFTFVPIFPYFLIYLVRVLASLAVGENGRAVLGSNCCKDVVSSYIERDWPTYDSNRTINSTKHGSKRKILQLLEGTRSSYDRQREGCWVFTSVKQNEKPW